MPGLEENSSRDVGIAVSALKSIADATGGSVMAVHHSGKDTTKGMRGSSALFAAADFVLRVDAAGQDVPRELHVEKVKDGEPSHVASYTIHKVTIGNDEKGKDIEAAIIEWVEGSRTVPGHALAPKQGAIIEHVRQLILEDRFVVTEVAEGIPGGMKAVAEDDLIDRCLKVGNVTTSEQPKAARQSIRNQLTQLQQKGLIGRFDGKVWLRREMGERAT